MAGNIPGMLGMHGTKTSNLGVSECDLLIAIGTRFSDRVLGNPKKFADQDVYKRQTICKTDGESVSYYGKLSDIVSNLPFQFVCISKSYRCV